MSRSLWSGTVSFGLVNIPVSVVSAKEKETLSFKMLDERDHAPVGYKRVNKRTGEEVPRDRIVKAYECGKDEYVIVTPEDFERANPKAAQTVEIEDFVPAADLDPLMMKKPYYLVPAKNGEKGYQLLRKALVKTGKIAIGRFVMRQKQRLVAIIPQGNHLVLEVLRYAREVLTPRELDQAGEKLKKVEVSRRELEMATQLVKSMSTRWDPDRYHDTYTEDLLRFIGTKARHGDAVAASEAPNADFHPETRVLNLMPLLRKSLESGAAKTDPRARKTGGVGSRKPALTAVKRKRKRPGSRPTLAEYH